MTSTNEARPEEPWWHLDEVCQALSIDRQTAEQHLGNKYETEEHEEWDHVLGSINERGIIRLMMISPTAVARHFQRLVAYALTRRDQAQAQHHMRVADLLKRLPAPFYSVPWSPELEDRPPVS